MSVHRTLHHFPLDPASRQARLALAEKRLPFSESVVRFWEEPPDFLALNPSGVTPVLVEGGGEDRVVICEIRAILEHLERESGDHDLLGETAADRAETRRLLQWFDRKFDTEVNGLLLHEKLEKRLLKLGAPDLACMREGREALREHLGYLERLLADRNWLAGKRLSLADFAAAAHISVLDYFGDVPWRDYPTVKLWYMKLKSRPAFRGLLSDRWPGLPPAAHYDDLDF
ncbi:MAG TPA: glutathione S-transferase family protein [Caulobacteraceae bacterium]|nr:glutathione S-transferase family protein [Caulobacteraceae bacterium]